MRPTTALRSLRASAALGAALALSLPVTAHGEQSGTFTITAAADFTTIEYFESRTPIIGAQAALAVVSPASAQASLDSLGTSTAFASAPYPGPIIVSLPGTASGPTGGAVPEYPFYVSSSFPVQQEETVDQAPYLLRASSQEMTSSGVARTGMASDGQRVGSTTAAATTSSQGGELVTEARTSGGAMSIDLIRISDLQSLARIEVSPNGKTTPSTNFSVSGLTVGGQGVEVTADGLVIAGTTIPIDATPLAGQMAQAGIELHLLSPETGTSANGAAFARSGGLRVSRTLQAPDGGSSTYVYTFGQSVVTATSTAFEPISPAPDTDPIQSTHTPIQSDHPPEDVADPQSESPPAAVAPLPPNPGRGISPESTAAVPSVAPPALSQQAVPPTTAAIASGPLPALALGAAPGDIDGASLYLVLVAAAVAAVVGSRLMGALGVKLRLRRLTG